MLDLMFAAALSGMRAAEAADDGQLTAIDYTLAPGTQSRASDKDWRKWVGSDFNPVEDQRDCPIFFQTELSGFGTLRVGSACDTGEED